MAGELRYGRRPARPVGPQPVLLPELTVTAPKTNDIARALVMGQLTPEQRAEVARTVQAENERTGSNALPALGTGVLDNVLLMLAASDLSSPLTLPRGVKNILQAPAAAEAATGVDMDAPGADLMRLLGGFLPGAPEATMALASRPGKAATSRLAPVVASQLEEALAKGGGFTFDPRAGQMVTDGGFAVANPPGAKAVVVPEGSSGVQQMLAQNADLLKQPGMMAGGWRNGGQDYLEVSQVFPTLDEAMDAARQRGEKAIFDLATKTEIPVTPEAPLTSTLQRHLELVPGPGGRRTRPGPEGLWVENPDGSQTGIIPTEPGQTIKGTIPAPEGRLPNGLAPDRFYGPSERNPEAGNFFRGRLRDPSKPPTQDNIIRVPYKSFSYESEKAIYDVEVETDGTRRYKTNGKEVEQPTRYHRAVEERYGLPADGPVPEALRHNEPIRGHLKLEPGMPTKGGRNIGSRLDMLQAELGYDHRATPPGPKRVPVPGAKAEPTSAPEKTRMRLSHFSSKEGLTSIDPKFAGSGTAARGAERARGAKASYFFDESKPGKYEFGFGRPSQARYDIEGDFAIYDLEADPEGIRRRAKNPGTLEKELRKRGYDGYRNPEYESETMKPTVVMLRPVPVSSRPASTRLAAEEAVRQRSGFYEQMEEGPPIPPERYAEVVDEATLRGARRRAGRITPTRQEQREYAERKAADTRRFLEAEYQDLVRDNPDLLPGSAGVPSRPQRAGRPGGSVPSRADMLQAELGYDHRAAGAPAPTPPEPPRALQPNDGSRFLTAPDGSIHGEVQTDVPGVTIKGTIPPPEPLLPSGLAPDRFYGPTESNPEGGNFFRGRLRDPSKPATQDNIIREPWRHFSYETHTALHDIAVGPDGTRHYLVNGKPVEKPTRIHRAIEARYGLPAEGPVPPEMRHNAPVQGHLKLLPGPWRPTERGVFDRAAAPELQGTAPIDPRLPGQMARGEPSELAEAIADSPKVLRGLKEDAAKGLPRGGASWYELGPVKESIDAMGGPVDFEKFLRLTGSASIQNPTHNELGSYSALLKAMMEGTTFKEAKEAIRATHPGYKNPWGSEGTLANATRAEATGAQLPATPGSADRKVAWYTHGKAGGAPKAGVALDTHERRRLVQLALKDPKLKKLLAPFDEGSLLPILNAADYDLLSSLYQKGARQMGLPSAQAFQAGRWLGGGEHTGLRSAPTGDYVQILEDAVLATAKALGRPTDPASLRQLWREIVQGRTAAVPMYSTPGPQLDLLDSP